VEMLVRQPRHRASQARRRALDLVDPCLAPAVVVPVAGGERPGWVLRRLRRCPVVHFHPRVFFSRPAGDSSPHTGLSIGTGSRLDVDPSESRPPRSGVGERAAEMARASLLPLKAQELLGLKSIQAARRASRTM